MKGLSVVSAVSALLITAAAFMPSARAENVTNSWDRNFCYSTYEGQYSNGVKATYYMNGNYLTIHIGGFVFHGTMRCQQWGSEAEFNYRARTTAAPGEVKGRGTIAVQRDGRVYMGLSQNNGLLFNGIQR